MMERGRINGWQCDECGQITYAVHVDDGVTPMFLACRASGQPGCGRGVSLMYPDADPPEHVKASVAWEWFRPSKSQMRKLSPGMRQHVEMGGLDLRPLTGAGRAALRSTEEER